MPRKYGALVKCRVIRVRLTEAEYCRLREYAHSKGRTISEIIRLAIREYVGQM